MSDALHNRFHSVNAGIEDMRVRREEVQRQIQDEEVEKGKIQQDLAVLTKRLGQINNSLARKVRVAAHQPACKAALLHRHVASWCLSRMAEQHLQLLLLCREYSASIVPHASCYRVSSSL